MATFFEVLLTLNESTVASLRGSVKAIMSGLDTSEQFPDGRFAATHSRHASSSHPSAILELTQAVLTTSARQSN